MLGFEIGLGLELGFKLAMMLGFEFIFGVRVRGSGRFRMRF